MDYDPLILLDNPVWHALQTTHKPFAIGTPAISRYPADILPFLALENTGDNALHKILPYVSAGEKLFIVGDLPALPSGCSITTALNCAQMICPQPVLNIPGYALPVIELGPGDMAEMFELVNRVQPGYYKEHTPLLGSYYGIKINGKLVAMAGERLRMTGASEISAVCTLPEFTGRGFARLLVAHACRKIQESGGLPFLHVLTTNTRAIGLYELLRFQKRREIIFWQVALADGPV